jgi:predicted component of type VI protein secretion system
MDDPRVDAEAGERPVQGPHWRPGRQDPAPPGWVPLRLRLLPAGPAVECTRPDVLVGRHSHADIRLPLPDVSRRHCRLVCAGGTWQVVDLNSLNGIFVNGEKVQQATLRHRDQLRIGGFTLEVDLERGDPTVRLADEERPTDGVLRSIADALPGPDDGPSDPSRRAS